ncbi:MAG: phosphoethanolamine--lipid A transferase, partial [Pseudomonadota bacterium]
LVALLLPFAWRWTLKPVLATLLIASAAGLHFMLALNVLIDPTMLTNVFQTDLHEATDLVGARAIATLLLLGVAPAVWLWRQPVAYGPAPRRLAANLIGFGVALALVFAGAFAMFQPLASTARNHKALRYLVNPINSLYALGWVATRPFAHTGRRDAAPEPLARDARLGASYTARAKSPLLVLVVGETGRSGNFGLNGYARQTTPELERESVISQRDAWSCGTSTAASLPCMFSHLGRTGFEARGHDFENLLDVLQHAGLAVIWLDNQSGCKGVCARVPSVSTVTAACPGDECPDGVLLEGLDERIAALPAERRARGVVVVMHPMGSHGPAYWRRSPAEFKRFLPECRSIDLQDCSNEQIVNAYDNSIAYTDHVLASTIRWLRARESSSEAALLYVADHGESLGENNLYLHGMPWAIAPDVQKRVPWITWLSPAFLQRDAIDPACLRQQQDRRVSHDNYFHSVLGLLDVRTEVYDRRLDLYADCARRP